MFIAGPPVISKQFRKALWIEIERPGLIVSDATQNILCFILQRPFVLPTVMVDAAEVAVEADQGFLALILRSILVQVPCCFVAFPRQFMERLLGKAAPIQQKDDLIHHVLIADFGFAQFFVVGIMGLFVFINSEIRLLGQQIVGYMVCRH